jgi:hypothetical protein
MQQSRTVDPARLLQIALAAGLVWFAVLAVQLARLKFFSIDEFQYAHAAWLVADGQVPYRDFFEVHFPLVYQVLAPVFVVGGDDPTAVVGMRLGMLPLLAMACGAVALMNGRQSRLAVLAAPVLLLALPPFVTLATEIRPDAAAAALFLASLAVLRVTRLSDRVCGAASGFLLVASAWGSQKAAFYGSIYALALIADLVARRSNNTQGSRPLLRSPIAFVGGVGAGLAVIAIYLTATKSWNDWWNWCFVWAVEHQRHYPGFSWRKYFDPILIDAAWVFVLAAWGLALTLLALRARGRDAMRDPDLLLVAALASTFASFALQRAPYPYSFLAFLAIVTVFAARGVGDLLAARTRPALRAVLAIGLVAVLAVQSAKLAPLVTVSNAAQLDVLSRIGRLTAPDDPAYDNSGSYVTRPHAYTYFYTDSFLRESIAETLAREVPRAIVDRGAVLHVRDLRFDTLPPALRTFLDRHFQPIDGDVALWGQHYVAPPGGALADTFLASRDDRYFVSPASALERAVLTIDGEPVREPVFRLSRGEHRIAYQGQPGELNVLWLPRDGTRWEPRRGLPPTLSRLF